MVPTMLTFLLCWLAMVSVHRIWHYEDIFAPVRASLGAKVFLDPTISWVWISPLVCLLTLLPENSGEIPLAVLACYAPLRGLVWLHAYFNPAPVCSPCEAKRKKFQEDVQELRTFEKRVVFIGADAEQANWLAQKHPTWVIILTGTGEEPKRLWKNVRYRKIRAYKEAVFLIMMGGNGTIVTWNVGHTPEGRELVRTMGNMKGVSWVHVGTSFSDLPAHHKTIPPTEPLDQHL